eukprot:GHRQ01029925.1.p1 GENE.GHRQ01029925.1~~GHRQ01029925.1.p1  ORF type:complete len:297 (-),score=43.36 GHRQ01029925.1:478-1368(-)
MKACNSYTCNKETRRCCCCCCCCCFTSALSLPGDYGFDPLGLADPQGLPEGDSKAVGSLQWLSYAELIHGRWGAAEQLLATAARLRHLAWMFICGSQEMCMTTALRNSKRSMTVQMPSQLLHDSHVSNSGVHVHTSCLHRTTPDGVVPVQKVERPITWQRPHRPLQRCARLAAAARSCCLWPEEPCTVLRFTSDLLNNICHVARLTDECVVPTSNPLTAVSDWCCKPANPAVAPPCISCTDDSLATTVAADYQQASQSLLFAVRASLLLALMLIWLGRISAVLQVGDAGCCWRARS